MKTIQMRTCPAFRYGRTYPPPRALRRKRLQNGMPEPASATMRKQFLFPFRFFPFKRPAPFANTALSLRAVSCAVPACGACLFPFGPRSVPIRCLRLRCVCRPLPVRLFAFCAYIISQNFCLSRPFLKKIKIFCFSVSCSAKASCISIYCMR